MPRTNVMPDQMANSLLGKIYDLLTMGDENVARSTNDFFSWCTPGIPYEEDQFDFLTQGFTAMVRKEEKASDEDAQDQKADETASGGAAQDQKADEKDGDQGTEVKDDEPTLEQKMGQQAAELYQEAENLARFVDFIPSIAGIDNGKRRQNLIAWNPDGGLSNLYRHVLRMSQVVNSDIDDKTKAKIEKLRGLLVTTRTKKDIITDEEVEVTEPSEMVKRYFEKMSGYLDAVLEHNSWRTSALNASTTEAVHFYALNASKLKLKVKAAYDDWVTNGYKEEYEKIGAFISQVMSRDLTLLKAEYKNDLDNAVLTGLSSGSDFLYTTLLPGNFAKAKGWTEFSFSMNDHNAHYDKEKTDWGVRAGFLGFGGGGVQSSSTDINQQVDWTSFKLTFEMTQVPIIRPWFHPEFLTSRFWRFHPETSKQGMPDMLSDGKIPPTGHLVAYPTAMVLVRNLRLEFRAGQSAYKYINDVIATGGGFRFGPISLGGRYKHGKTEYDFSSKVEGQGITVPGMQVIGFRCHMLPKSPNPVEGIKDENWV